MEFYVLIVSGIRILIEILLEPKKLSRLGILFLSF